MSLITISGAELRDMVSVAAAYLEKNKKAVDALNVFPVPDGDTGTNMSLTLLSAAREVASKPSDTVAEVSAAMATGSLRGARGNSGVILSQIFRGFAKGLTDVDEMTADDLATALERGVESAYKAVMKPKEGTILTVAKSLADSARRNSAEGKSVYDTLVSAITDAEETLQQTPEMLPVLKEAGVVDSGGMGLMVIFNGFKMSLDGVEVPEEATLDFGRASVQMVEDEDGGIEFGYCTEFIIKNEAGIISENDINRMRGILSGIGDSVLVVGDSALVKVHVHTNEPGVALQHGLNLGVLSGIKVDNMREEHHHVLKEAEELVNMHEAAKKQEALKNQPQKDHAMVAVAAGDGIAQIFKDLGVDVIVEGGQSMNPSTEDIIEAIEHAPSQNVFVFPNNKNIIMAAEQAAGVVDKNIEVIRSISVPQGISAAICYSPDDSFEENASNMNAAIEEVESGLVTYAVRDTTLNGRGIKEGDILGMCNDEIAESGETVTDVTKNLIKNMVDDDKESISLFYGKDVQEADAESLVSELQKEYDMYDVQMYPGGQPLYYYIISVE